MNDYEKNTALEKEETGIFKIAGMLVLFVGFIAGMAAATAFVLRRVRNAMKKFNKETDFEPLDEEDLTKTGECEVD